MSEAIHAVHAQRLGDIEKAIDNMLEAHRAFGLTSLDHEKAHFHGVLIKHHATLRDAVQTYLDPAKTPLPPSPAEIDIHQMMLNVDLKRLAETPSVELLQSMRDTVYKVRMKAQTAAEEHIETILAPHPPI